MIVRSPRAIGAAIRDRRHVLGLDQSAVANMAGVTRQWLSAMERGKDTVALGLVLRTLTALGIELELKVDDPTQGLRVAEPAIDIDAIVSRSRRTGKTGG